MNAEQQGEAEVARTNLLNRAYISLNDALHARACGIEPRYPLALIEGLAAELSRLRARETELRELADKYAESTTWDGHAALAERYWGRELLAVLDSEDRS